MSHLHLPYRWTPRPYQQPVWRHLIDGILRGRETGFTGLGPRAVCVWHRRAGKDRTALNLTAVASQLRAGAYAHVLPTYRQGRKVIWEGKTREGAPMRDAFPPVLYARHPRSDEMTLWVRSQDRTQGADGAHGQSESLWQVIGSDHYDALRGTNFVGVVFSEYAWQDPRAWEVVSPILAENGGWALFLSTPNGMNHFHDLYDAAGRDERWFGQRLTVDDTRLPDGRPVIDADTLEHERRRMSAAMFEQEYYCSFAAGTEGAYYAADLGRAEREGRIRNVPWEPALDVWTWWDLGVGDATVIWFVQLCFNEVRLIDYHEDTGQGLVHYVKLLREKPYCYGGHVFPHDVNVRELGTGRSRREIVHALGLHPLLIAPRLGVEDGIEAVRTILPRCYFDRDRCRRGLAALRQYRTERDEARGVYRAGPVHDWTSHAADAFRYGALLLNRQQRRRAEPVVARSRYSVFES